MNPNGNDRAEQRVTLEQLIRAALRSAGVLAPETEKEVDRFCAEVLPEPVDASLVERATRIALGHESCAEGRDMDPAWPSAEGRLLEDTVIMDELIALHRKEGEISPEVQQKLEQYRKAMSESREGPDTTNEGSDC